MTMLYKEAVEPETLDLIFRLQKDELFKAFALMGDAALSLQIGHRLATVIALSGQNSFDASLLSGHLSGKYQAEDIQVVKNGVSCRIERVSVDLQSHQSPLIKPVLTMEDLRILSLEDIGAMKLNALVNKGPNFTDFIDIYKLLEQETLEQLIEDYETKYPGVKRLVIQKVFLPPDDMVPEPVSFLGEEITIQDIAYRLKKAIKEPKRIFESVPWRQTKTKKNKQSPDKSRGKGMR